MACNTPPTALEQENWAESSLSEEPDNFDFIIATAAYLRASWKNRDQDSVDSALDDVCNRLVKCNETLLKALQEFKSGLDENQQKKLEEVLVNFLGY